MKICVVSNQVKKAFSGIGLHTHNLLSALVKDNHELFVIAPESQKPEGILPYTFIGVSDPLFNSNQGRWISLSFKFSRALNKLEKQSSLDIIHFTDARESLFYRGNTLTVGNINDTYSADLKSVSYYKKYYSDWFVRWIYYNFVNVCERIALHQLNAVIANSKYTTNIIRDRYRIKKERLYTCYKSIDLRNYSNYKINADNANVSRILFVGSNMQRKGLPVLIRSAKFIINSIQNVEFWVIGEDKALPKIQDLCRQERVRNYFYFHGWKSQADLIEMIYPHSNVFVMPSLTEALGMVFIEAMASGVPVVGTNIGGIPEIIEDRINGRLVNPDDPKQLAEAIIEILSNPELSERYRAAGYETAKKFSLDQMMKITYMIYRQVLNNSSLNKTQKFQD